MKRQITIKSFIVCFLFCGFLSLSVEGATNPTSMGHYFKFKHEGNTYSGNRYFTTRWNPADTGWDSHYTSASNKYDHSHAPHGFPFDVTIDSNSVEVTVAKSDDAWDDYYTGYTRFGSSTFSENCHGYSTGYGMWTSMPTIRDDDYTSTSDECDADIWTDGNPHAITIEDCCFFNCEPNNTVQQTAEKNTSSGYYRKAYFCPGGTGTWSNLYKHN